ncbi:MAG: hypothetical protein ACLTW0_01860 [Alistipes ihumii]|jgi:hypothetical protein|uniref:hypothetical protein n=1 Tax=Alistipes ihumii TaxID=1470347 RepID=UPI003995FE23
MANYSNRIRRDLLKYGKKTICYIDEYDNGTFKVKTGKPSDAVCISWTYESRKNAVATAIEFFNNYTQRAASVNWVIANL